ncbi:SIMPL domain-containing protein [Microbulbifer epialgicus]|uniref:SIMPL domain-containing protein n=1 Tax=Microbulbifer epialgicus TaxID=393907 RepID=A0ABV4P327_9GAMM
MSKCQNQSIPSTEHIVVTGSSTIEVKPDLAIISVSIQKADNLMVEAKANVDERTYNLINYLKSVGVRERDINTSKLRIAPNREYRNGEYIEKDYKIDRDLTIKLRDLAKYDEVLERLVQIPIDKVPNIKMEISNRKGVAECAIREAIENAKSEAKLIAELMSVKLGPIYSISNAWSSDKSSIGAAVSRANYNESSFEPGTIEINGGIEVVYYLEK